MPNGGHLSERVDHCSRAPILELPLIERSLERWTQQVQDYRGWARSAGATPNLRRSLNGLDVGFAWFNIRTGEHANNG